MTDESVRLSHAFRVMVLEWLQKERPDATAVLSVNGDGTDWEGDTDSGFYSRFGVEITYLTAVGKKYFAVTGDDMEELWNWIVRRV